MHLLTPKQWDGEVRTELCEAIIAFLVDRQTSYDSGFEANGVSQLSMSSDELDYISDRVFQCQSCGVWVDVAVNPPEYHDGQDLCRYCYEEFEREEEEDE